MTIAEAAVDEQMLMQIVDRVRALQNEGMTEQQAVARVAAEFRSFAHVAGSAHFAFSEAILQARLKTNDWDESITSEQLRKQFLPD